MSRKAEADGSGPGERIERARQRRKAVILGLCGALGLVTGFVVGYSDAEDLLSGSVDWPPALAIGMAFAYLAALVGGGIALSRHTDEFELETQYKAVAVAAFAYILLYPVWLFLWFGALVPEPMHGALFLAFWVSLAGASIYYKFR